LIVKAFRLYYTIKYLKLKQIIWRAYSILPRSILIEKQVLLTKRINFVSITKTGITADYNSFTLLNESHQLTLEGWDNKSISKLWSYNLHYFDFLRQDSHSSQNFNNQKKIIRKWIEENPFGKGIGWDPYPTSLRIINWIKWHYKTNALTDLAKLSLWNQIRWLSGRPEFHLLGNHLFVNAKAMLFGSAFFCLGENSSIYRKALKILKTELDEQFLNDGAHFELSPMYHSLAMEDLLDLYQLSRNLPCSFPKEKVLEKYKMGMNWLSYMKYDNEEFAHFNDCANGMALEFKELQELSKKIGLDQIVKSPSGFLHFTESGFVVIKDNNVHLIADIGSVGPDYLPGHAHADTLSFELAIKGQRVIVNSGTSEYGISNERLRQRSTAAHSTIEVDGTSSSEVWSGFRVARRATVSEIEKKFDIDSFEFSAVHDGYTRLVNQPRHKRSWRLGGRKLEIFDEVTGNGNDIKLRFYIHPCIQVLLIDEELMLKTTAGIISKISSSQNISVESTTYHDEFGVSRNNNCLLIEGNAPFNNIFTISWNN
jgi:uncharacterized heparinase superfamily protein